MSTYKDNFKKKLKEFGVDSLKQLSPEKKKIFFKSLKGIPITEFYLFYLNEAGFENKPKGWTTKSIKKAGTTLAKHVGEKSPEEKGFFDKCVKRMQGKIKNPEGYCASLKSEEFGSTYWRGKGKTKKEVEKDVKQHRNV